MKKEWFEIGNGGVIPFANEFNKAYSDRSLFIGECISAAFRVLIAEDAAQEVTPPALAVGDVVRLEACDEGSQPPVGHEGEIYRFDVDGRVGVEPHWMWPLSACTLVRRAGEAASKDKDAKHAEIARLRAEVERLTAERDALQAQLLQVESFVRENNAPPARISKLINQRQELAILNSKYIEAKHQRDALRARIDAGVPVTEMTGHSYELPRWFEGLVKTNDDQRTGILLIDARPIDQPDAAMVDERTGKADRREVGCDASLEARLAIGRDHTRVYVDDLDCNGTVKCARSNDRRRTAGTRADRRAS